MWMNLCEWMSSLCEWNEFIWMNVYNETIIKCYINVAVCISLTDLVLFTDSRQIIILFISSHSNAGCSRPTIIAFHSCLSFGKVYCDIHYNYFYCLKSLKVKCLQQFKTLIIIVQKYLFSI